MKIDFVLTAPFVDRWNGVDLAVVAEAVRPGTDVLKQWRGTCGMQTL